jgi:hypothetical protein
MDPAAKESPTPGSYEVGYGKPPVQSRFKSGQSGNPKGRRKETKGPKALLQEALSTPVTITEGGVTKTIELSQALFRSLAAKAVKGDIRAAGLVIKLMEQFGIMKETGEASGPIIVHISAQDAQLL